MSRKRSDNGNGDGKLNLGKDRKLDDPMGRETFPKLFELLSPYYDGDKCRRLGARMTIQVIGGLYVVKVNCPTEQVVASIVGASLANLLEQVESGVASSSCVWFPDYESQKRDRQQAKL